MTELPAYAGWSPQAVVRTESISPAPVERLLALLDDDSARIPTTLSPLAHWLYYLPAERQSDLDADGHPRKGGFLPPVPAPRRMWAGGRIDFIAPIAIGASATRTSEVTSIVTKKGRSGTLTFVTVRHEISVEDRSCLIEEQDLVYRDAAGPSTLAAPPVDHRSPEFSRTFNPDITALFRFSALTYNAHRIHYDREYATREEGYDGLVVHGPYQAMLLIDHLLACHPGAQVRRFSFRGVKPLICGNPFELCATRAGNTVDLWTRDANGHPCMQAKGELQ